DPGYRTQMPSEIVEKPAFENFLTKPTTLYDHLHWQLSLSLVPTHISDAIVSIIGNLNEDGYLTATVEEIAATGDHSLEDVAEGLKTLQTFDPAGVGARDLAECLMIQLSQLKLNTTYKKLIEHDGSSKDGRDYVKERYSSAIQFIKNIEQRKQTIVRVCEAIVRRQAEFLDQGIDHLRPMMIKDVAEEVGVHPSTVSRAVANKYAHTPQGVFELRYFFSEAVQGPAGSGIPLIIAKRKVKKLIEADNSSKPLTDDQITKMLNDQGIMVTRRTVAKYREDMKIPST